MIPVYILRDPIHRAWSAFKMLYEQNPTKIDLDSSGPADFLLKNYLDCKYKETIEALDTIFKDPLYFFYEDLFRQDTLDLIFEHLIEDSIIGSFNPVNKGIELEINSEFIEKYGLTKKNIEAVRFISERFTNVPWKLENYL